MSPLRLAAQVSTTLFAAALSIATLGVRPAAAEVVSPPSIAAAAYREGLARVQRALAALGGAERLRKQGWALVGEGTYDLSTRLQGQDPDVPQPFPMREVLVYDPAADRLVYESDTWVNADAREHLRFDYRGDDGRLLFIDLLNRRAFWDTTTDVADDRLRYERIVPHLLLADALRHGRTLRALGDRDRCCPSSLPPRGRTAVSYTLLTGETLTLLFSPSDGLLYGVEYLLDMPLLGDMVVRWQFLPYRQQGGLGLYPEGYRVFLGDRLLRELRYTVVASGPTASQLQVPADIEVPPPPAAAAGGGAAARPLELHELAENVFLVPNVRSGFHHLVVELRDGLLVVDAPTGWYEMQQLPAKNWVPGETSSSVARRLLAFLERVKPGKPVRYLVLTHHHSDHAGGVRPFVAAGATVVASEVTAQQVRRAVAALFTLAPDEISGRAVAPRLLVVEGERVITDGTTEVRLLEVGPNPHADGLLVVHLPRQRILYQADLFEPLAERFFPSRGRLPMMRFFVGWLEDQDLADEQIISIHGSIRVTEGHLAKIRAGAPSANRRE